MRDISVAAGITERTAQAIVADLEAAGYFTRARVGRRTRYTVNADRPFRHQAQDGLRVGPFLDVLTDMADARPGLPRPADHACASHRAATGQWERSAGDWVMIWSRRWQPATVPDGSSSSYRSYGPRPGPAQASADARRARLHITRAAISCAVAWMVGPSRVTSSLMVAGDQGIDTLTAATTSPERARTGAAMDRSALSSSSSLTAMPVRRTWPRTARARRPVGGRCRPACRARRLRAGSPWPCRSRPPGPWRAGSG